MPNVTVKSLRGMLERSKELPDPSWRIAHHILLIKPALFADSPEGPVAQYGETSYPLDNLSQLIFALTDVLVPLEEHDSQQESSREVQRSRIMAQHSQAMKEATKLFRLSRNFDPSLRKDVFRRVSKELHNWRDRALGRTYDLSPLTIKTAARNLVKAYLLYAPQASANLIAAHVIRLLGIFRLSYVPAPRTLRRYISIKKS